MKRLLTTIKNRFFQVRHTDQKNQSCSERMLQIMLNLEYKKLKIEKLPIPTFDEIEFSCYSQNGEDGILLFLFSVIGTTNKKGVEICAGDGIECNLANLIIHFGWDVLLFDGNKKLTEKGKVFYENNRDTFASTRRLSPKIVNSWVTKANVNDLLQKNGFSGNIDLLSLDMDGIDFWIWEAIDVIEPRVVIVEYNNRLGKDDYLTIPYSDDFKIDGGYFGASLGAFVKLSRKKGYRLIGCNRPQTNAVFLKNDICNDLFPEVTIERCLNGKFAIYQNIQFAEELKMKTWIPIE